MVVTDIQKVRESVVLNDAGKTGRGQTMKSLVVQNKHFGLCPKRLGKPQPQASMWKTVCKIQAYCG